MQKTNRYSKFTVRRRNKVNSHSNIKIDQDNIPDDILDTKEAIIVLNFIDNNCNIHPHANKHNKKPNLPKNWKAGKRDRSYWKSPEMVPMLVTEYSALHFSELLKFVQDETAEVLEMKVYVDEPVGILCRKGESEFYPVNWFCAIIQKTKDGLITKTCYPCEDPYKK